MMATESPDLSKQVTPPHSDKLDRQVIMVAAVVVLGAIMSILDTTVVAVAQEKFQHVFDTDQPGAAWTMTGYTLALATVIPLSSWAAARFGTKRVYLASLVMFVIGSVLCAFAWSIGSLVAFRVVQGFGGGMLMPVGMMILTRAAGQDRVGSVMAVLGIPMLLGPVLGPILGGILIEYASWHWLFLINVPIGVVAFVYSFVVLKDDDEKSKPPFDFIGLLLLSPGLAAFLYGASSSASAGSFTAPKVWIPMVIGAILIIGFVWHALIGKVPLLDLRLFTNPQLSWAVVAMVLFMMSFMGSMLLYPQYFQTVRGESTVMAGLLVAPQGIGAMFTMPVAGRMTDKIGPGKFVLSGIALLLVGMAPFMFLSDTMSYWLICGALFVQGLGMGMTMMPIMSAALATLRNHQINDGSTLMNVVQQTASSIGTAIISVILLNNITSEKRSITNPAQAASHLADAYAMTFVVSFALVAVTFLPALFLPRKKIATTGDAPAVVMH